MYAVGFLQKFKPEKIAKGFFYYSWWFSFSQEFLPSNLRFKPYCQRNLIFEELNWRNVWQDGITKSSNINNTLSWRSELFMSSEWGKKILLLRSIWKKKSNLDFGDGFINVYLNNNDFSVILKPLDFIRRPNFVWKFFINNLNAFHLFLKGDTRFIKSLMQPIITFQENTILALQTSQFQCLFKVGFHMTWPLMNDSLIESLKKFK